MFDLRERLHSVMQVQSRRLIEGRVEALIPRRRAGTAGVCGDVQRPQCPRIEQLIVCSHERIWKRRIVFVFIEVPDLLSGSCSLEENFLRDHCGRHVNKRILKIVVYLAPFFFYITLVELIKKEQRR